MQNDKLILEAERRRTGATNRGMPWNRIRRATGIARLRGYAATRSEHATGGSQ